MMGEGAHIEVLVAAGPPDAPRYQDHLAGDPQINLRIVTHEAAVSDELSNPHVRTDILVVDQRLCDAYTLIAALRERYPRLLILLVDEEADFVMPGRADEVSIEPFNDGDLLKRIKRMTEERRLDTLRTDVLPQIRAFARSLRRARSSYAKQNATVDAVRALGYDYAALYETIPSGAGGLALVVENGPDDLLNGALTHLDGPESVLVWVSHNGHSRVFAPRDDPAFPALHQRRFATAAAVPVGSTFRFGVILACHTQPDAITQQHVLMLELISAQLANALVKQT